MDAFHYIIQHAGPEKETSQFKYKIVLASAPLSSLGLVVQ
jgi:hypothetical protein